MSTDESRIAYAEPRKYLCRDLSSGEVVSIPNANGQPLEAIAFHPDGRSLALGLSDGTLILWEVVSDAEPVFLRDHTQQISELAFHPDGSRLASASDDGTLKIWDMTRGRLALSIPHGAPVERVAWSPDWGRLVTVTRTGRLRIYDARELYAAEQR